MQSLHRRWSALDGIDTETIAAAMDGMDICRHIVHFIIIYAQFIIIYSYLITLYVAIIVPFVL
jgi:hypothetical protein